MIGIPELRRHLNPADSGAEDAYAAELEAAAVALVERLTGRYFGPVRTTTEFVIGTGSRVLRVDGPIVTVGYEPIVVVNERLYSGDDPAEITAGADDGFVVRDDALYRKGGRVWFCGYEYEITYQQGYAEGTEPADIRLAVMQIVGLWYAKGLDSQAGLVQSETIGNYSYTLSAAAAEAVQLPVVISSVNAWRRMRI